MRPLQNGIRNDVYMSILLPIMAYKIVYLFEYGFCPAEVETSTSARHIKNPGGEQGVGPRFGAP